MLVKIAFGLGFVSWMVSMVSWGLAVRHRVEGQTLFSHVFNGTKAFDSDNFKEQGKPHQFRMMCAFAGFFVSVLMGFIGVGMAGGTP